MTPTASQAALPSISFRYKLEAWVTWTLVAATVAVVPIFFLGGGVENLSHMNSRNGAPLNPTVQVFWQALFALGLSGWGLCLGLLVSMELTGRDLRIDCGATSMTFPRYFWSRQRVSVAYSEIVSLSLESVGRRGGSLEIASPSKRYRFAEALFESGAHFEEFCRFLSQRTPQARGPSARSRTRPDG